MYLIDKWTGIHVCKHDDETSHTGALGTQWNKRKSELASFGRHYNMATVNISLGMRKHNEFNLLTLQIVNICLNFV